MDWKDSAVVIAALLALSGSVWQFWQQQRQANRQPFLRKQLDLCFQATESAARLAAEVDPKEWEKARVIFWRLYWGTLCIVENRDVERAMYDLGLLIPSGPAEQLALPLSTLGKPSLRLAHAVRDLILKSWKIRLPALVGISK